MCKSKSRSKPRVVRFREALALAADRIAGKVGDKRQSRSDSVIFKVGAKTKPITEQMRAWQYELKRMKINRHLRHIATRTANQIGGSVCLSHFRAEIVVRRDT